MAKETVASESGAKGIKNFRSNVDIENFYRFINENDLRREATVMLEFVHSKLAKPKKRGRKKKIQ
jgi:hypothetical protein